MSSAGVAARNSAFGPLALGVGKTILVAAVAAVLIPLTACHRRSQPPNVLLIVADALRADRLGAYGSTRNVTPFLDSLAARGHVFLKAYGQSAWTSPSVASLFTSLYPSQHGVVDVRSVMPGSEVTLAEVLRGRGYVTGAFIASILLRPAAGYSQGFDHYRVLGRKKGLPKPGPERVRREGLAWLDAVAKSPRAGAPIFLYLHYLETHEPYVPPQKILDRVLAERGHPPATVAELNGLLLHTPRFGAVDPTVLEQVQDLYDASVASLDADLRRLFAGLDSRGFLDNALIVFTADHGEALKEHTHLGHAFALYDEVVRIPLIMVQSGEKQRTNVQDVVSHVDIAATIMDIAGAPPVAAAEGRSLCKVLGRRGCSWTSAGATVPARGGKGREPAAYLELAETTWHGQTLKRRHARGIVTRTRKLLERVDGTTEGFDLTADPGEKNPHGLSGTDERDLRQALEQTTARLAATAPAARPTRALSEKTKEELRALGYDVE